MKKIDATKDSVFKAFMEDEKTRDYKAKLIHYITGIKEEELKNAEYVSRKLYLEKKNDKTFKSDIIVTFENEIIIQINLNDYPIYTKDRLLYEFGVYEKNLHILHPMNLKIYEIDLDYLRKKKLELNLDIATIKEVTGLKEEEIMNLK